MGRFTKRKRGERANRYRVLAQQLDFHLATDMMGAEVERYVRDAKAALLEAATALEKTEAQFDSVSGTKAEA